MSFDLRDVPITSTEFDLLDTGSYADAISQFILNSKPPVTISVQGEWGCGKTSLLKMIEKKVNNPNATKYYESVWINTWEFFVNNTSDHACEQIILYILREITKQKNAKQSRTDIEDLKLNVKRYLNSAANITMDIAGVTEQTKKSTIDVFSDSRLTTVSHLRDSIEQTINRLVKTHNGLSSYGFVFYVDDLDRIDPVHAIRILEIIKNLFDIDHCVFILAIDYEIITRGLKEKYGEGDIQNEAAYRAYFDKLIQLPFSMPIKHYDSKRLIEKSLTEIGYFNTFPLSERDYNKFAVIVKKTINNNPRSWKRIANALFLSDIIDKQRGPVLTTKENRIINFVFVSLQIGYPKVYAYMMTYPGMLIDFLHDTDEHFITKLNHELKENLTEEALHDITAIFDLLKNLVSDFTASREIILNSATTSIEDLSQMKFKYDGRAYDKSSQTQYQQGSKLIDKLKLTRHANILDLGCGNGKTTIELYHAEPSNRIVAIDQSSSQIDIAIENRTAAKIPATAIDFQQMDALDLKEKEAFDLIFSNAALHWIIESKVMYTKIFEALKPNGTIAIHQGGAGSYRELHEVAYETLNDLQLSDQFSNWQIPLFYPTKREMQDLLESVGFSSIKIESVESNGQEYSNLIENFSNASLLPYLQHIKSEDMKATFKRAFVERAKRKIDSVYTHRLYVFAEKGR